MTRALRPHALPHGGTIGICSPAGPIDSTCLDWGIDWLRRAGFDVRCAPHVCGRLGYLAGSDEDRLQDFLTLMRDPSIHAVMYSRGGYGTARWLHALDPAELRSLRKLVIGHSDATILSLYLHARAGLASIHGPMLQRTDLSATAGERLIAMACGEARAMEPIEGEVIRGGYAEGPLIGGNLTMITSSLGTPWEIDARGCILFLEDIAEQPYAIDRQLRQLAAAGKLEGIAGIALGQFVNCESKRYPEPSVHDVLYEALAAATTGPILQDLPFGHVADNRALSIGLEAVLDGRDCRRGTLALSEAAVESLP